MNKGAPGPTGQSPQIKAADPGAVYGFVILACLIALVAFWMLRESAEQRSRFEIAPAMLPSAVAGFRADLFYLPDEELLGFVNIPAGPFLMGSNPAVDRLAYENERWSDNQRQGSVALDEFYMGRYEVTVAQFLSFLNDTGRDSSRADYGSDPVHPVHNVTWAEALNYARWLQSALLDADSTPARLRALLQDGWTLNLPSEAQWEKAARGNSGEIYPWGTEARKDRANFSSARILPVGSFSCPECSYGLADMSGNVWEMTRSPYQPYPYMDADSLPDPASDPLWVMRGGSYSDAEGNVRAATRGAVDPGVRNATIGFRLALIGP